MSVVVASLLVYTLAREVIFWLNTQRLLNKLMSRDYHSYSVSQAYKPKEPTKKVVVDDTADLEFLNETPVM